MLLTAVCILIQCMDGIMSRCRWLANIDKWFICGINECIQQSAVQYYYLSNSRLNEWCSIVLFVGALLTEYHRNIVVGRQIIVDYTLSHTMSTLPRTGSRTTSRNLNVLLHEREKERCRKTFTANVMRLYLETRKRFVIIRQMRNARHMTFNGFFLRITRGGSEVLHSCNYFISSERSSLRVMKTPPTNVARAPPPPALFLSPSSQPHILSVCWI